MRVLFFSPVPVEGAGCRARIVQYLPYLAESGIEGDVRPFMDKEFYSIAYKRGRWLRRGVAFLRSYLRRVLECLCLRDYDVIYIYRECAPLGPPIFEWLLFKSGKSVVYDLDDAVYMPSMQEQFSGKVWNWLKWYKKVPWILRRCDHVVVGNSYLKQYTSQFSERITIIPTPEEPSRFSDPGTRILGSRFTIGWIGTHSTTPYLLQLKDVFRTLAQRYDFELKVIGAGQPITIPEVRVVNIPWSLECETEVVPTFDIGVYPLSGSAFDKGKACYKAILYMAAGVPFVASNCGANREIVTPGVNGLLASSEDEWIQHLSQLIEDSALRKRLAHCGRQLIISHYSVSVNVPKLIQVLRTVATRSTEGVINQDISLVEKCDAGELPGKGD